ECQPAQREIWPYAWSVKPVPEGAANRRRQGMSVTHVSRKGAAPSAPAGVDQVAREVSAVTRLLEAEGILDYSGHVSTRVPGRDAFVIQIGSTSRAEVTPASMLVVDYEGKVLAGDGQPPSELPIHIEILKARPDVQSVLHSH